MRIIRFCRRVLALILVLGLSCAHAQSALNVLLIGVDDDGGTGRSDTMLLVRADPLRSEVRMVSFLRDLYVHLNGFGYTRLNAAYVHGGEGLLRKTLADQFGVEVHRTVTVHFDLLQRLVDDLGGIEMDISEAERRHLNALLEDNGEACLLSEAGLQRLNGIQTLCFSRIRKLDSDFQRTSRQQAVIAAMIKQASTLSRWQLLRMALVYLPQLQTDLTIADVAGLLPMVLQSDELAFHTAQVPFEGAYRDEMISGMMVLAPDLEKNQEKLEAFLNGKE